MIYYNVRKFCVNNRTEKVVTEDVLTVHPSITQHNNAVRSHTDLNRAVTLN